MYVYVSLYIYIYTVLYVYAHISLSLSLPLSLSLHLADRRVWKIGRVQAKNTTDATTIKKLVFAQQAAKRAQAEMSETIAQLTVKVRTKIASLLDAMTLASFAGYEG